MSNWKKAYGWSGHIVVSSDDMESAPDDNLIAIPPDKFKAIVEAHDNCKMDERIETRELGVTSTRATFMAIGSCFSEGFTNYGTVFDEAEARATPGPPAIDHDAEYLKAMKEIYGLELPPCRLMIGCASES
jgi:hypothetical protein